MPPQSRTPAVGADVTDLMRETPPIGGDVSALMTPTPPTTAAPVSAPTHRQMLADTLRQQSEAGIGVLQGVANTAIGLGEMMYGKVPGVKETASAARALIQPTTPAQRVGFHLEQLGEFLTPLGLETKTAMAISQAPRVLRAGGQVLAAGAEAGLKTAAHGGDAEDVVAGSLLGSLSPVVAKSLRGVGKFVSDTIPEHLYARIFPTVERDWRQAIAQQAKGATPDPTLAREVLERGLFGSVRNMALYATKKLNTLEAELQPIAAKVDVSLPQKADYVKLLADIQRQFGRSSFSQYAATASGLGRRLQQTSGTIVKGTDALDVKRFLDGLRTSSAFRMNQVLSARQDELKGAADLLRSTLRQQHPTVSGLLEEEHVFIQAFDALSDQAVKGGKKGLVDFMDLLAGSLGGVGGGPAGAATGLAIKRAAQSPFTLTSLGQAMYRAGQTVPRGTADLIGRLPAAASSATK